MRPWVIAFLATAATTSCAPHRAPVVFDLRKASPPDSASVVLPSALPESYSAVPSEARAILGCDAAPESPVCSIGEPTAEEDSAFRAEGTRLSAHADSRCRKLGSAISQNAESVRMYPKALVRWSRGETFFGVGHAYEMGDVWFVRIARSIDDLNERTLDEKKRTLRHEMSHTIGATETVGFGWTAEDYATRCS